jgi:hypothetical protein
MKKIFTKLAVATSLTTVSAFSAVDVSAVVFDVGSVEIIAAVMLGALAIIWVARKVVGFLDSRNGYAWDSQEAEDAYDRYEWETTECKYP